MDKRFFLAVALCAAVVVLTNVLFPGQRKVAGPDSARAIAGAPAARVPAGSAGVSPVVAAAPVAGVAPSPALGAARAADTLMAAVAEQRTTVATRRSTYEFSNVGAAPMGITLTDYRESHSGKEGALVQLARSSAPMLTYALVVRGDTVPLDRTPFQVISTPAAGGAGALVYEGQAAGGTVRIAYTFSPDSYAMQVRGRVDGVPTATFVLATLPTGLRAAERDTLDDQTHLAFTVKPVKDAATGIAFGKVDPGERKLEAGPLTWVTSKNKYFLFGMLAPVGAPPFAEATVTGGARTGKRASNASMGVVIPVTNGTWGFDSYAGPIETRRLSAMGREFDGANPVGGFFQPIVQPFAALVVKVMLWLHETLKLNYGWVLVIFGAAMRLVLWPLNARSMRTSLKMQRVQPELQAVQEKYKSDPPRLQAEMMKVYKAHDMSPFSALSGCIPALIPMPVFFALLFVFQNTIEFRGASFLYLSDISLKDPFYIMPLITGATAYLLSWIGMRGVPPNPQTKMMTYMFPAMMVMFCVNAAAGLSIYYAIGNLAALPQQWMISNERAKNAPSSPDRSAPVQGSARSSGARGRA
jgi:YidC/Oxa1 family membrane protein insertase